MSSEAQIEANRKNAKKSSGPRTQEGKDQSRRNALRHGLCAEHIAIFDEDPDDFARFHQSMLEAMTPLGEDEKMLADRVAMGNWRLRRVWRMEAAAMNEAALKIARARSRDAVRLQLEVELAADPPKEPEPKPGAKPVPPQTPAALAAEVMRGLSDEEVEAIAVNAIEADETPRERTPTSPDTLVWPAQAMQSLSRYEAQITRDIDRASKALRELQALRAFALAEPEAARLVETRQIRRATERMRRKYGSAERSQILAEFGLAAKPGHAAPLTPTPSPAARGS
jgi:hypothetical protein